MQASRLSVVPVESFPLDTLKSTRRDLEARLADVRTMHQRLMQARDDETAIHAEIGQLGETEIAAIREWSKAGGQGDMPQPDHKARAALHKRLVEAQARTEAAKGAANDLAADEAALSRKLASTHAEIERMACAELIAEFDAGLAALQAKSIEIQREVAAVYGLRNMFAEQAWRAQNQGLTDAATEWLRLNEGLAHRARLDFAPLMKDVASAAPAWLKRFEELVR